MRRKRARNRWRWEQWLVPAMITLLFGFASGYATGLSRTNDESRDGSSISNPMLNEQGDPLIKAASGEGQVQANTKIEEKVYYLLCDQVEDHDIRPLPAWIGLDHEEFVKKVEPSIVISFSSDRIVLLRREAEAICPEMMRYRTVGIEEGHVAIRYGRPDLLGPLIEVTDIPVHALLSVDQERLETGIVVESQEQALRVVEGLSDSS